MITAFYLFTLFALGMLFGAGLSWVATVRGTRCRDGLDKQAHEGRVKYLARQWERMARKAERQ